MKILRWWGPVVLWMLLIFLLSTRQRLSVSPQELVNFLFFKALHLIEYGVLYVLVYRALKNYYPKAHKGFWVMWAFILVIGYAATDEVHQLFVPTREGKARDVIIDAGGATLAWISIELLLPKMPRTLQKWVRQWLAM